MTARDCLKMIREGVIDCRTAGSADQRNALSDELLRDDNAKMGANLRDQANKRRRDFVNDAAAGEIACGFGH